MHGPKSKVLTLPDANGLQYKVGVYADDSLVKSIRSVEALFNVIKIYELGSGAKLNVSKTEAMWLGAWRSRTDQPFGLTWVPKVKILGVVFGQTTESENWRPKLKKLENHLNLWKSRSLSFVGKSLIVNSLGISKLLYLATILPIPKWVVSEVNNLIWPFLWGSHIFLLKYLFGSKLSSFCSEWGFLRDNSSPSAQFLTPFYSICSSVVTSLRKILYFQDWPIGFNLDRHWSLVRDGFFENFKNDPLWLIVLRAVKVRDSMNNWG